jgi:hypothetical protein
MKRVSVIQALDVYLEVEEALARAQDSVLAPACPTLGEWADHICKDASLRTEQYGHALKCHLCQNTTWQLRHSVGGKGLVVSPAARDRLTANHVPAGACPAPANRFIPTVLANEDKPARVELTYGPFLSPKGRLSLTIDIVEPTFTREELPVQVQLVVWPEGTVLHTFELPALQGQQLVVQLPAELLAQEQWQSIQSVWPTLTPEELPLRCVLEPGTGGLAGTEPAPAKSDSASALEMESRHVSAPLADLLGSVFALGSGSRQRASASSGAPLQADAHLGRVASESGS